MTSSSRKEIVLYAGALVLCSLLLFKLLGLSDASLEVPFTYGGDGLATAIVIKNIINTGWYLENPVLGAPGNAVMNDYAIGADNGNFVIIKILGLLSRDPFVVLNLFYLFTYVSLVLASVYALRMIGVGRLPSLVSAVLFSLLPYHFLRNEGHLFLSAYWIVPLCFILILWMAKNRFYAFSIRTWLPAGVLIVVIGSGGIYYAYFSALFLGLAGLLLALSRRKARHFVCGAAMAAAVLLIVVFNLLPTFLYQVDHGQNTLAIAGRDAAASELYGLKIARLLLPSEFHRNATLAAVHQQYPEIITGEATETLGFIGAAGFLGLVAIVFYRGMARRRLSEGAGRGFRVEMTTLVALLALAGVIIGTIGGLSSLIAYFWLPQIRCYNRISVFIGWFAFVGVAFALNELSRWMRREAGPQWLASIWPLVLLRELTLLFVFVVLLGVGVYDQTSGALKPAHKEIKALYARDVAFTASVEELVPQGAMIFQLPYMAYPESGPIVRMPDYDHFRASLYATKTYWSYGAMKGRTEDQWQKRVASLPPESMVKELAAKGFAGVTVSTSGYADNAAELIDAVSSLLAIEPLFDSDHSRAFFNLVTFRARLEANGELARLKADQIISDRVIGALLSINQPIRFDLDPYFKKGWSAAEASHRWSDGNQTRIEFQLDDTFNSTQSYSLVFTPAMTLGSQRVKFGLNSRDLGSVVVEGTVPVHLTLPSDTLVGKGINRLDLALPDAKRPGTTDQRILGVAVSSFTIVTNNQQTLGFDK